MTQRLWDPMTLGKMTLGHRPAMAPMTRGRSMPAGVPTPLNAEYYAQRTSTALYGGAGGYTDYPKPPTVTTG
ncbi:oxidoreductase [Streptomyces sp. NPDC001177]